MIKTVYPLVPREHRDEFHLEILQDNIRRLSICSLAAFIVEFILLFLQKIFFNSILCILVFLAANVILIPIIWYFKRNVARVPKCHMKAVIYLYSLVALAYGVSIAVSNCGAGEFVYVYLVVVFCVTSFLFMPHLERALILLAAYLVLAVLYPMHETDRQLVIATLINTFVLNLFAFLQGGIMLGMKLNSFIDKKLLFEKNQKLTELVYKDTMTGLYNHEASFYRLGKEIEKAEKCGAPLSLIIIDIDDFKQINDQFGHQTGDQVLIKLSKTIADSVRSTDIVGRYGGEEFIIILPETDLEEAYVAAERLQAEIRSLTFSVDATVTVSGGISQYSNDSMDHLIRITDRKLYKAKGAGKDQFVL